MEPNNAEPAASQKGPHVAAAQLSSEGRVRLLELFGHCSNLPEAEREAYLGPLGLPGELLGELRALLRQLDHLDDFLKQPADPAREGPQVEPWAPAPAQMVGPYRLLMPLGRGTSGVVWLAQQVHPSRKVALKILRWDHGGADLLRRFRQEADLLARLDHPACARVLDAGLLERHGAPPLPWIAMAYVEGQPLGSVAPRLSWPELLRLFEAIAAGVHAAHRADIVHRDLKPDNVLVDRDGQPVVLDFGVARLMESAQGPSDLALTETGLLIGTPAYMAPEQARGDRARIDARSDVFALAAMLYEALTGELPIDTRGACLSEAIQRVANGDPVPLRERLAQGRSKTTPSAESVPGHDPAALAERPPDADGDQQPSGKQLPAGVARDLERVLAQALHREPEHRYASARALADDLANVRNRRPVSARPPSLLYQSQRLIERHPALSASVCAALVCLSLGLVLALAALKRARSAEARIRQEQVAVQRLADLHLVPRLEEIERSLWPAVPARLPELEYWLNIAEEAAGRLATEFARQAADPESIAPLEREPLLHARRYFHSGDPLRGLAGLRTRLSIASRLHAETIEEHAEAWSAAAQRVQQDPRFVDYCTGNSFLLQPILGLIPLGPDPSSQLEEFAEWPWTGRIPRRDPVTGELEIAEDTAAVLVLLPGGLCRLGFQGRSETAPRYHENARPHECIQHAELAPYLFGKYEFTQGQWQGLGLANPSYWEPGDIHLGIPVGLDHMVTTMTWQAARAAAQRLGLELPSEAQWEAAAWAQTDGEWDQEPDIAELQQRARSPELRQHLKGLQSAQVLEQFDRNVPLPVGMLPPNPYGIFELVGGGDEWCLDQFWPQAGMEVPRLGPAGLAIHPDAALRAANPHRVLKGSGYWPATQRPALGLRNDCVYNETNRRRGFRLALTLPTARFAAEGTAGLTKGEDVPTSRGVSGDLDLTTSRHDPH